MKVLVVIKRQEGAMMQTIGHMAERVVIFFSLVIEVNTISEIPVMAAVAVRKKIVSIDHFSPSFCLQSL